MTFDDRKEALPPEMAEWLSELSVERHQVLIDRMRIVIENTVGKWDDDSDPVLVETAFIDVAGYMFLQDTMAEHVEAGRARVAGINSDGEYIYESLEDLDV